MNRRDSLQSVATTAAGLEVLSSIAPAHPQTGNVRVGLRAATEISPAARLRVEHAAVISKGSCRLVSHFDFERDAYVVPLGKDVTWVELSLHP